MGGCLNWLEDRFCRNENDDVCHAIRHQNTQQLQVLKDKGKLLNTTSLFGRSSAELAVATGNVAILKILHEDGVSFEGISPDKWTKFIARTFDKTNNKEVSEELIFLQSLGVSLAGLQGNQMVKVGQIISAEERTLGKKNSPLQRAMLSEIDKRAEVERAMSAKKTTRQYLSNCWGIAGKEKIFNASTRRFEELDLEGITPDVPFRKFSAYLEKFLGSEKADSLTDQEKEKIMHAVNDGFPTGAEAEIQAVKKHAIIVGGTSDHAVGFVLDNSHQEEPKKIRFMIGNRGEGKADDACAVEVYEMNPSAVTEEFVTRLRTPFHTMDELNRYITKLIADETIKRTGGIRMKDQEVGNCPEANLKAAFLALLTSVTEKTDPTGKTARSIYKNFTALKRDAALEDYLATKDNDIFLLKKIAKKIEKKARKTTDPEVVARRRVLKARIDTIIKDHEKAHPGFWTRLWRSLSRTSR